MCLSLFAHKQFPYTHGFGHFAKEHIVEQVVWGVPLNLILKGETESKEACCMKEGRRVERSNLMKVNEQVGHSRKKEVEGASLATVGLNYRTLEAQATPSPSLCLKTQNKDLVLVPI